MLIPPILSGGQAGTIALITSQGGSATVIALSYGERGESGELWKDPDQTVENVKRIRHEQASAAAKILGAEFRCFDLGDYPLNITDEVMEQLVGLVPRDGAAHCPDPHSRRPVQSRSSCRLPGCAKGAFAGFGRGRGERLQKHHPARPVLFRAAPAGVV